MPISFASSPFTSGPQKTAHIMKWVLLCSLPGLVIQIYYFGWGTLVQLLLAIVLALLLEGGCLLLRKRPIGFAWRDYSVLVTAWLLAISIPPLAPWWIISLAIFFAVVVAKHLYGGLGQNIFNPAMIGYVVVLVSFPVEMTSWQAVHLAGQSYTSLADCIAVIFTDHSLEGYSLLQLRTNVDGVTAATPLDILRTAHRLKQDASDILNHPHFFDHQAKGWVWVNIAYLAAGLVLLFKRIIQWYIPLCLLFTLSFFTLLHAWIAPASATPIGLQLFSGATMLGAFFIATDPVSASTTVRGKCIYGALIGGVVYCIRSFGGYPDGMAFAVLCANMVVPLLDSYTQPKPYGYKEPI